MNHVLAQLKISTGLRLRSDLHIIRKLWHMATGLLGLVIFYRTGSNVEVFAVALLTLATLAFVFEFLRLKFDSINQKTIQIMKPIMRESERNSISGLPFYALGVSLSLFFYQPKIAIISILFLIFADPIASFFGILYGKDKILPNKSLQGTIAAFTVCYLVTFVFGIIHTGSSMNLLVFSIIGGAIGAISELCSQFVDDNLCIPVLSGFGLSIAHYFFPLF